MPDPQSSLVIAIDGGAASGKSSTSRLLAKRLNLLHVDTGSHYRAVTHALLQTVAGTEDLEAVITSLRKMIFQTRINGQSAHLEINGQIPSAEELRSPQINQAVSSFAALPEVRSALFDYQRGQPEIARENDFAGLVMEGRDIGSVILPNADFRFYLFADENTRAARRASQGESDSISRRDLLDKQRETAPLTCPEGAIRIDTGALDLEGVVRHIATIIENA